MTPKLATLVGFLAAPLVPVVVGFAISPNPLSISGASLVLMAVAFYAFTLAYIAMVGIPLYRWLKKRENLNMQSVMASGAAMGMVSALLFHYPNDSVFIDLVVMAPIGFASAMVFWFVSNSGQEEELGI